MIKDKVHSLYIGKIKQYKYYKSAIDKSPVQNIYASRGGIVYDQQAYEFHGTRNRAILHYPIHHYEYLSKKFGKELVPGSLGENLVASELREEDVCIGDIYRIGKRVVVQVTQPRLPCFKPNKKFGVKGLSEEMERRCGWFYKVLQEGGIEVGDEFELLEKGDSNLTIEKIARLGDPDNVHDSHFKIIALNDPHLDQVWKDLILKDKRKKIIERDNRYYVEDNEYNYLSYLYILVVFFILYLFIF
jgi:MOSC domain-containing protein YiiM